LRPKKAKDFIPDVALDLGIPDDLVKEVVNYYWEEVRRSLSSLKHQRVHITNLGDFTIKHWKIDEKMESLKKWEENNKLKGLQEITKRFKVAETLYDLNNIKGIISEENQRKEFIKLHKKKSNGTKS
jgi:nucleoid DNA-binding protein